MATTARFTFERLAIPEVILVKPKVYGDSRGFFCETYRANEFAEGGIADEFVQENHSRSGPKILRGIHFQTVGQAKLVRVALGSIFDVAVDLRPKSPTFKQWVGVDLSDDNMHQLFVPKGFGHAFVVTGDGADVMYKVGPTYFVDDTERGIRWDDPEVAIRWPVSDPATSERDSTAPSLADFEADLHSWFGDLKTGE